MHVVLLPGLDGTGDAFAPLIRVGFDGLAHTVVSYPPDRPETYDANLERVRGVLEALEDRFIVVAESYSGPLGVRLAADPPERLAGVILVATFVTSPVPHWLGALARPALFARPPPRALVRHFLAGWRSQPEVADLVIDARAQKVSGEVFHHRVRSVFAVDVREELRAARVPLLYIKPLRDRLVRTTRRSLLALQPALAWEDVNAPHMVLQARPRESSRIICDFAKRL